MNMPSFNGLDIEVIDGTARITIERTFNEDQIARPMVTVYRHRP